MGDEIFGLSGYKLFCDGVEIDTEFKELNLSDIRSEEDEENDGCLYDLFKPVELSFEGEWNISTQAKFNDKQADKYLKIARRTKSRRIEKKNMKKFHQRFMELLFGL